MKLLIVLGVVLSNLSTIYAAGGQYVERVEYPDGTYAYRGVHRVDRYPGEAAHNEYTQRAWAEMDAHSSRTKRPNALSTSYWPDRNGEGGHMIYHSSIRGGNSNERASQFINDCNIGGHRRNGMCAETATMAYARDSRLDTNNRVDWSIYGGKGSKASYIPPCQGDPRGCQDYVDYYRTQYGGGGRCVNPRKRDAFPAIVPPKTPANKPDAPGAPVRPGQDKDKQDGNQPPARLGGDKKPDDATSPNAKREKELDDFAQAVCAIPAAKTKTPTRHARDVPDLTAPREEDHARFVKAREIPWSRAF